MSKHDIESYMTKDVVCVGPDCPISDLLQDLSVCRASCVVVCEGDSPIGIITERDLAQVAANHARGEEEVREIAEELMTSPVTTIRSSDSVETAIQLMQGGSIWHLPVFDSDDRLIGLITQADLVRAQIALAQEKTAAIAARLRDSR